MIHKYFWENISHFECWMKNLKKKNHFISFHWFSFSILLYFFYIRNWSLSIIIICWKDTYNKSFSSKFLNNIKKSLKGKIYYRYMRIDICKYIPRIKKNSKLFHTLYFYLLGFDFLFRKSYIFIFKVNILRNIYYLL